jgi:threonine aldolase
MPKITKKKIKLPISEMVGVASEIEMKVIEDEEKKTIYLDTDCFNQPTDEMREAMRTAKVGDEYYPEETGRGDINIYRLEQLAAKKLGKESALFILNGTMANIIAIYTHCKPGDKIIIEKDFHMHYSEIGGIKAICRVEPIYIESDKEIPNINNILVALNDSFYVNFAILCLENPHNKAGGIITPPNIMKDVCELAHSVCIPIHLDGARIFNASISLGIDASMFTRYVDSVMLCLNKGLGAPVGAILAGTKEFIKEARKNRKLLGGHMRQMGIMAAAGIVALNNMEETLGRENWNAQMLGNKLSKIEGIKVDMDAVQVNKVVADISGLGMSDEEFSKKLRKYNIYGGPVFRIPAGVMLDDIYYVVEKVKEIAKWK